MRHFTWAPAGWAHCCATPSGSIPTAASWPSTCGGRCRASGTMTRTVWRARPPAPSPPPRRTPDRCRPPPLPFLALGPAVDRRMWGPYVALSVLLLLNLLYAYTRPYVQTFTLPPLIDGTLFSDQATRGMSALALLTLPWLLWILWRPRVWPAEDSGRYP